MGTTSEKLTYLNTTKTLIKEELNLGGANITNEPFREYKGKLEGIYKDFLANGTDTLWNNWLPKVTGTGEAITLNNTIEAKMDFVYKGNTSQYSTTGKNLLPNNQTTQTINGVTFTMNSDKSVTIKGTATANTDYYFVGTSSQYEDFGLTTGTYNFNGCTGGSEQTYMLFAVLNRNGNLYYNGSTTDSGRQMIVETGDTFRIFIRVISGTTVNKTIYPQINVGSTPLSYEPYTNGASPNPDYPQDIQVVTGDNTINICGKNLFNKNTITTSAYLKEDGTLQTGTGAEYITSDFIPVQPNTTYYKTQTLSPRTKFYDANKQVLDNSTYQDISIGGNAGSFTTPSNAYYFRFTGNVNTSTGININSVMVHKGSTATTFEPYKSQSYSVNLGSLELCKIGDYQDYIYKDNGKWYVSKQIGKIVLNGTQNITQAPDGIRRFNARYSALGLDNIKDGNGTYDTANYRMCDYFIHSNESYHGQVWGVYYTYNGWLVLYDTDSVISDATALANWFSNNNTSIYYVLATPTTTEITDSTLISQLEAIKKSYNSQTNISQTNDDMPFELDVVALGELEI